jgi:hypothetical protein
LLDVAIIRRHGIDRHDNFKSALYGAGGCVENRTVRGGADRDDRLDPLGLEDLVEIGIYEFVEYAEDDGFVGCWSDFRPNIRCTCVWDVGEARFTDFSNI